MTLTCLLPMENEWGGVQSQRHQSIPTKLGGEEHKQLEGLLHMDCMEGHDFRTKDGLLVWPPP